MYQEINITRFLALPLKKKRAKKYKKTFSSATDSILIRSIIPKIAEKNVACTSQRI